VRAPPGEFESLRLLAEAHDRLCAAEKEFPAFEARLRQLGYGTRSIMHAYQLLSGPGTVAEAHDGLVDDAVR
jgi:hypothetical protein